MATRGARSAPRPNLGQRCRWYGSVASFTGVHPVLGLSTVGKEGKEVEATRVRTTNTVHVEPSVYMIEWLWESREVARRAQDANNFEGK